MFWKHPITKKNRFLPVVHATNGIPSYFDHDLSKTSTHGVSCQDAREMITRKCALYTSTKNHNILEYSYWTISCMHYLTKSKPRWMVFI